MSLTEVQAHPELTKPPKRAASTSPSKTPISPSSSRRSADHRQALHLRRQGAQHQGDVYSPQNGDTVAEAYQAFLSILETNGLTVVPHGRFLKIVETDAASRRRRRRSTARRKPVPAEDRYVTRMLSARARQRRRGRRRPRQVQERRTATSRSTRPGNLLIITDTGTNIRRMMPHPRGDRRRRRRRSDLDRADPLRVGAPRSRKRINEIFDVKAAAARGARRSRAPATTSARHAATQSQDRRRRAHQLAHHRRAPSARTCACSSSSSGSTCRRPARARSTSCRCSTRRRRAREDAQRHHHGAVRGGAPAAAGRGAAAARAAATRGRHLRGRRARSPPTRRPTRSSSPRRSATTPRCASVIDRLDHAAPPGVHRGGHHGPPARRAPTTLGVSFHGGAPFDARQPSDSLVFGGNKIRRAPIAGSRRTRRAPGLRARRARSGHRRHAEPPRHRHLDPGVRRGPATRSRRAATPNVLATPHILATDNVEAEINVGENIPLQTNVGGSARSPGLAAARPAARRAGALGALGGSAASAAASAAPRQDVGTKIKVTPHINDSNEVRLEHRPRRSASAARRPATLGARVRSPSAPRRPRSSCAISRRS